MNELKGMNGTERMTWMTWNEWLDMTELKWMNWKEWLAKSAPNPLTFLTMFCEILRNRALATVSCAFCQSHLPKLWNGALATVACISSTSLSTSSSKSGPKSSAFTILMWNRALSTVPCTFCRPLSRIVSRPRVFSAVDSRVPSRSHFSTTSWWCGWHDDLVLMMMYLVDMMVRQLAVTMVHNSEVS